MGGRTLSRAETLAIWLGIAGNALLFCGKISIGLVFDSIAIISDSLNSFTDIVASLVVFISVRTSYREADEKHPYGHKRAQPIAGLIIAIFTGIVGFEIIVQSVGRFFTGEQMERGILPVLLVVVVMVVKLAMHLYVRVVARASRSTALMASATDHRNDVLISGAVLVGVVVSNLGYPAFDPVVAILIGLWIIKAGYAIGRDNIKYLMGETPTAELMEKIRGRAREIPGVLGLNGAVAHYVGTTLQIELHIFVDRDLNVDEAHAIGQNVQRSVEEMDDVSRAFIHIDPIEVA